MAASHAMPICMRKPRETLIFTAKMVGCVGRRLQLGLVEMLQTSLVTQLQSRTSCCTIDLVLLNTTFEEIKAKNQISGGTSTRKRAKLVRFERNACENRS